MITVNRNNYQIQLSDKVDESARLKIDNIPHIKFNPTIGKWILPINLITTEFVDVFSKHYKLKRNDAADEVIKEFKKLKELNYNDSDKEELNYKLNPNFNLTLKLFQNVSLEYIERNETIFLSDDMGLGKTIQALAFIHQFKQFPTLIVCPSSLKYNWLNEVEKCLNYNIKISVVNSKNNINDIKNSDIVIINYEILNKFQLGLQKIKFKCLIVDESHNVKNSKSQRTKSLKKISKKIKYVLLLTGTPVLNAPIELMSQLQILRKLNEFGGEKYFKNRYCNPTEKIIASKIDPVTNEKIPIYITEYKGATNTQELNRRLKETCYIRRLKSQVLKELPAKNRILIPVEIDNRKEYNTFTKDVKSRLLEKVFNDKNFFKSLSKKSIKEKQKLIAEKLHEHKNRDFYDMSELQAVKQLVIEGKINAIFNWIDNFLESDEKLVIFAVHIKLIEQLIEKYKCDSIYGSTPIEDRQGIVDRFQNDKSSKILVLNILSGGTGLTLTVASTVLFTELWWTPGLHDQAEDRCHRIGQTFQVNIYYLYGKNTVEQYILNVINQKRKIVNDINNGENVTDDINVKQQVLEEFLNGK